MTQISANLRVIQAHAVADRQLSPKEFQEIETQFKADNPQATEADFKAHMMSLLKGEHDATTAQLESLFQQADSGHIVSLDLGFDEPLDFDVEVKGAHVEDKDGIHHNSKGDISGRIDSVSGSIDLFGDELNAVAKAKLKSIVEDNLKFDEVPDEDFENKYLRFVENLVEDTVDAGKDALESYGQDKAKAFIEGSSIDISPSKTDDGKDAIELNLETPLFSTKSHIFGNGQGGLVIDTDFETKESDGWLDAAKNSLGNLRGAAGQAGTEALLEFVQDKLNALGVETQITNDNGTYTITPKQMTLTAAQFKELTGQELPAGYENGEITLKPENIELGIKDGKVHFEVKGIDIKGSSDTKGPDAKAGEHAPTVLDVDSAKIESSLTSDGTLGETTVSDVEGSISGETNLSPETLNAIKDEISQLMTKIDTQLQAYGLSREQLTQMLSQMPNDLLQSLLSSNNMSDIADASKTLGIDSGQLEKALAFLKEEPYRQMIADIGRLSNMIEENTQIKGNIDFQLKELKLSAQDSDFLATLKGFEATAKVSSTTPEGVETTGDIKAKVDRAEVDTEKMEVESATAEADLTVKQADPDRQAQLNAFRQSLQEEGPNGFIKEDGYLKDEGPDRIRNKKGLEAKTARGILERVDNETLLRLQGATDEEIKAAAKDLNVKTAYLKYMVQYAERYVTTEADAAVAKIEAEASVDRAKIQPGQSEVDGAKASADLTTLDESGEVSSKIHAEAEVSHVETDGSTVRVSNSTDFEKMDAFRAQLKSGQGDYIKPNGYLKDEGIAKIRTGDGLTAKTASRLLEKISNQDVQNLRGLSDADIEAHGQKMGLSADDARLLRYSIRYMDQYVTDPAVKIHAKAEVPGSDTSVEVDTTVSGAKASKDGVEATGVRGSAELDSDSTARVSGDARRVAGSDERLELNDGRVNEFDAESGDAHISGKADGVQVEAEDGKVNGDASVDWRIQNDNGKTEADISGTTQLQVRLNELYKARTKNMKGEIKVSTKEFLDIARSAGMGDFVDTLLKDKTLLSDHIFIKLDPATGFDYNKGGTTQYNIKARIPGVQTKYGPASLSFETNTDGKIKVNTSLQPNVGLARAIKEAVETESGGQSERTAIEGGKINVDLDIPDYLAEANITTTLEGDKVRIKINDAKFLKLISVKGTARDKILKALAQYGARLEGNDIVLPTQSIAREVLKDSPQTASSLRNLNVRMGANNRIDMSFTYTP